MSFEFTQAENEVIKDAKRFAAEVLETKAPQWARGESLHRDFFLDAASYGLCGLVVPTALGGKGLRYRALAAVLESLSSVCFSSTFALVVHNNLAANIAINGRDHHKTYLNGMLAGEKIGAFLLTEPGAGSDATSITSAANRTADSLELSGAKAWITNGRIADVLSVYAQTKADSGAAGIANYLIDAERAGIQRTAPYELSNAGAMNVCGFEFTQTPLQKNDLMIDAGRAFKVAMSGIDVARVMVAVMCCGMLQRSLQEAITYIRKRQVFGRPIADHQYPQHLLADVSTDLQAAAALTERAVQALEDGAGATIAAAHAKKFATKIALQRIADCMQMMGAVGALGEYPMSRHLACAKLAQYVDGTSEIQNIVLSRALLKHE